MVKHHVISFYNTFRQNNKRIFLKSPKPPFLIIFTGRGFSPKKSGSVTQISNEPLTPYKFQKKLMCQFPENC